MVLESFLNALKQPSPCDNCTGRKQCGELGLACNVFLVYVETGRISDKVKREPTAQLFDDIMDNTIEKTIEKTRAQWRKEMRKAFL
jgi:hypothetical protein